MMQRSSSFYLPEVDIRPGRYTGPNSHGASAGYFHGMELGCAVLLGHFGPV